MPDNHVKRIFDFKDEIIQKIYGLLCDPSVIHSKYPDLVIYLPKEEQKIVATEQTKLSKESNLHSILKSDTPARSDSSHHKSKSSDSSESESESTTSSSESSSQNSDKHHRRKHKSRRPPSSWPSDDQHESSSSDGRHKHKSHRAPSSWPSNSDRDSSSSDDEKKVVPPIVAKSKNNSGKQAIEKRDNALKAQIAEVKPITK